MEKVGISSCLLGEKCRYDGKSKPNPSVFHFLKEGRAISICPECEGGLPIPRPPAQIAYGGGEDVLAGRAKVICENGDDVTDQFINGAKKVLEILKGNWAYQQQLP